MTYIPAEIQKLIERGAVFYSSQSGGKDSQAMQAYLEKIIPAGQLVVVHADLGAVEWAGVLDHIESYCSLPVNVVQATKKDGSIKTFLGMVEDRGKWPSSSCRQCTSDLKRDPIMKLIRHDLKARGARIAVNCVGLRAAESSARAKKEPLKLNARESKAGREVFDWLPIFDYTTAEVFAAIAAVGQQPHPAYVKNERLSCVFCIMGSLNDLRHGAEKNPQLYKTYVDLEKQIGHTVFQRKGQPVGLEEYTGIEAKGETTI